MDPKRTSLNANPRHIGQEKGGKKAKIWGEESWGHNETLRCYVCSLSGSRVYPKALNSNIRSFGSDCLRKIVLRKFAILTRGLQVADLYDPTPPCSSPSVFQAVLLFLEVGFIVINSLLSTSQWIKCTIFIFLKLPPNNVI